MASALGVDVELDVFLRPTREFTLPGNLALPLIMIGPGTGVAPFRGFLEHRLFERNLVLEAQSDVCCGTWRGEFELVDLTEDEEYVETPGMGRNQLFFGCRHHDRDFIYEHDLRALQQAGVLAELHTAFSRDQPHKVYVQHHMREPRVAADLARLILKEGAHVYVCGDGANMARDVEAALLDILADSGGLEPAEARAQLAELARRQRYVRDIWS